MSSDTSFEVDLMLVAFGPVIIKLLHGIMKRVCKVIVGAERWDGLSEGKQYKSAMHITKALLYGISFILVWPIAVRVMMHHFDRNAPFKEFEGYPTYDMHGYILWIPSSIYLYELVVDENPPIPVWCHHTASIAGFAILRGALVLGPLDTMIMADIVLLAWAMITTNVLNFCVYSYYHMGTNEALKAKLVFASQVWLTIGGNFLLHVFGLTYLIINFSRIEAKWIVALLIIMDLSLGCEHVYCVYVIRIMARKCRERATEKEDKMLYGRGRMSTFAGVVSMRELDEPEPTVSEVIDHARKSMSNAGRHVVGRMSTWRSGRLTGLPSVAENWVSDSNLSQDAKSQRKLERVKSPFKSPARSPPRGQTLKHLSSPGPKIQGQDSPIPNPRSGTEV